MSDEKDTPVEPSVPFTDVGISPDADGDQWGDFVDSFLSEDDTIRDSGVLPEEDDEEEEIPKEETPPVVEELAKEEPPKEAPAKETPPKEDPAPKEEPKDAEALEVPAPVVEEPPASASQDVAVLREKFREQLLTQYTLSQEDAEEMELSPSVAFPKIAAKLHINVLEQVMASVQNLIPAAVQASTQGVDQSRKNEEEFYQAWPELKGHDKTIGQQAIEFRKKNPQASKEDAIRMVGFHTLVALGVDPVKAAARLAKVGQPQQKPAPVVKNKPHVPVVAGRRGSANRATDGEKTIWSELIEND